MSILSYFSLKSWVGDYTKDELKKFLFLSFIFALTIGIYWFLRTDKDGVFNVIVGYKKWAPLAKWISMGLMLLLTGFYGFLINKLQKHQIFYVFAAIYSAAALFFAFALSHPTIGIANTVADPSRLIGWAYYLYVESYGSLWVVLFWTFATDTTAPEVAKRWFPFMSFIAQCGSWVGSAVTKGRFGKFPVEKSLLGAALVMILVGLLVYVFMRVIPADQLKAYGEKSGKEEKKKLNFFEAAKAVFSQPYLVGIFLSITIYEIINTLFDYRLKLLIANDVESSMADLQGLTAEQIGAESRNRFNQWTGWVGENMALLGIASYILGLGNIGRKFGFMASIMLFPSLLLAIACIVGLSKAIFVVATACVIARGLNYAFYQPVKEQLYIPTSKDARYKSKGFIEMVGSRGSKALASGINMFYLFFPAQFPIISLGSSIFLGVVWLGYSRYLGKTYEKAVAKNEVVC